MNLQEQSEKKKPYLLKIKLVKYTYEEWGQKLIIDTKIGNTGIAAKQRKQFGYWGPHNMLFDGPDHLEREPDICIFDNPM